MRRLVTVLIATCVLAGATWARAQEAMSIGGTKLALKDDPLNATKKKVTIVSRDFAVGLGGGDGSGDDPRNVGMTVRIVSAAGDTFDATYDLPAHAWSIVGAEGDDKGYKYRDSLLLNGPVKSAVLKPARLKISAKGFVLAHTLVTNPDPVDVVVTVGSLTYCMHYGGLVSFKTPKLFSAKFAPAGTCPP